jgi:MAX dimerization protein
MSIAALIQAAEYLDRREREAEHGYATSLPPTAFELDSPAVVSLVNGHVFSVPPPGVVSAVTTANSLLHVHAVVEPHRHRSGSGSSSGSSTGSMTVGNAAASAKARMNSGHNRSGGSRKSHPGNRSTHNELEKNRRAHLRNCLEKLKDIVPVGADSSRHTTLGLLNKAKHFIKTLEDKDRKTDVSKDTLLREQKYLRRRMELLSSQMDAIHKRRSVSECSATSTGSSNHSSESDEHEVDVIGINFGRHHVGGSDDDRSSVRSSGSDGSNGSGSGGVAITSWTRQLTIGVAGMAEHSANAIQVQTA